MIKTTIIIVAIAPTERASKAFRNSIKFGSVMASDANGIYATTTESFSETFQPDGAEGSAERRAN